MNENLLKLKREIERAEKHIDRQYALIEQREDYLYASKMDGVVGATSFLASALYKYVDALEAKIEEMSTRA